ncbi:DUF3566 domain-containing protein [Nocardia asteroides]|uniref:DUF3566 domain-containing protein n=1 Tax=Nocardia asteroides TaxID=1824 RepID=UPI001E604686|nr:DUF3566 domain-containing protein [Nocardia asteroides]UGT59291.1 DUF3566 domain-containing protein [Nocardia asteroides]
MTTPNQPNDERHQTNGVTERIAPSPIPPRPIPRPGGENGTDAPGNGQGQAPSAPAPGQGPKNQGAPNQGHGQLPQRQPGSSNPAAAQGRQGPQGSGPQGQGAQGNGERAPEAPKTGDQETVRLGGNQQGKDGGPGTGGQQGFKDGGWGQLPQREPQSNLYRPGQAPVTGRPSGSAGLSGGVTNARTTADLAAKATRKEAAMVKSVGIDGPTRSISRPELVKDMPDLSDMRHPVPPQQQPDQALPYYTPGQQQQPPISPSAPVAVAAAVQAGEPLRATVQIRRIDPWSTLKITLVISVAMFFVWMLAVGLLYIVLEGMGVWERLDTTLGDMVSQEGGSASLIDAGTVFGYAGVIGLVNVVLFTALGTVGVFIYNQCCDLVGGIQVTLADPD